jgi:hypothetical protein
MLCANTEIRDTLWPFDFIVVNDKEYGPVWFDTAAAAAVRDRGAEGLWLRLRAGLDRNGISCWRLPKGRPTSWRRA